MPADREPKSVLALKATQRVIQRNVNEIYKICSALYEEIHTIKHFIGYKPPSIESGVNQLRNQPLQQQQQQQQQQQNLMNNLDNLNDFAQSVQTGHRKLKIIDN